MKTTNDQAGGTEYLARWERAFDTVLSPLEEFTHRQSSGSLLLAVATILALLCANSFLATWYAHFVHTPVQVGFGDFVLQKTLHHWVNDGLMAIFFFVVGLELKREFLVGELANIQNALLPIVGAIGGMVVPALFYVVLNGSGPGAAGWGIPMATDIAFAVGALVLLGDRIPKALLTFLIALAIVDDLGAVLVIAIFYTEHVSMGALGVAGLLFGVMIAFKYGGIRHPLPYLIMAVFLWFALLHSGVHATVAGILGALTIPVRPKYDTVKFTAHVRNLMSKFEEVTRNNSDVLRNVEARALLQTLENGVHRVQAPLQRLEHVWHMPVVYFVLPVFAFINAGVKIQPDSLQQAFSNDVTLGVMAGLVLGKTVGIAGLSYIALQLGIGQLPKGTNFMQIVGVALLGGIGFTMSIFVSELAFAGDAAMLANAKIGILIASVVAGIAGVLVLKFAAQEQAVS